MEYEAQRFAALPGTKTPGLILGLLPNKPRGREKTGGFIATTHARTHAMYAMSFPTMCMQKRAGFECTCGQGAEVESKSPGDGCSALGRLVVVAFMSYAGEGEA